MNNISPFTENMAYRLKEMAEHSRHFCLGCDERNSIDNTYFCLACGEVRCWQCVTRYEKKTDPFDGKMHPVCYCGNFFKLWDDWYPQAAKVFPELFR